MSGRTQTAQEQQEATSADGAGGLRSRRSLIAGVAAVAGAVAAQAIQPLTASANDPNDVVKGVLNTATANTIVYSNSAAADARALTGRTNASAGNSSAAVWGDGRGANGIGVFGSSHNGSSARGVLGSSTSGTAVRGVGGPTGVWGTGATYGVRGESTNDYGVFGTGGYNGVYGVGGSYGVIANGTNSGGVGVYASGNGTALYGSGGTYGLQGYGTYGVYGAGTTGVYGAGGAYGVHGYTGSGGATAGVLGEAPYRGIWGIGGSAGVYGGSGYVGLWGEGGSYGIYGAATATSGQNYGIYASTASAAGFAGYFQGNVVVNGTLSKAAGAFRIDHPLQPDRKWLSHSFVESPDMMNIYNGNVTTNAKSLATVRLPGWFGALNRDFRYQLTVIGAMAQAVIHQEVQDNRFTIRTSEPGVTVSWQVTGIRHDAYANAHRIKVETSKSKKEIGTRAFVARASGAKRMNLGPRKPKRTPTLHHPKPQKLHPRQPKTHGAA